MGGRQACASALQYRQLFGMIPDQLCSVAKHGLAGSGAGTRPLPAVETRARGAHGGGNDTGIVLLQRGDLFSRAGKVNAEVLGAGINGHRLAANVPRDDVGQGGSRGSDGLIDSAHSVISLDGLFPLPRSNHCRVEEVIAMLDGITDGLLKLPPDDLPLIRLGFAVAGIVLCGQSLYLLQSDGPATAIVTFKQCASSPPAPALNDRPVIGHRGCRCSCPCRLRGCSVAASPTNRTRPWQNRSRQRWCRV